MEKINTYTFANGLHLIHIEKQNFIKSFVAISTNFGARDLYFKDFTLPSGVAHFLEHKMFETSNGDYIQKFEQLGASVNAYTSYKETVYYFSTVENIAKPLNLLLDLVSDLQISEQSVEKEKAIIIQELNMYQSNPEYKFFNHLVGNMYFKNPIRFDIGGNIETVSNTTKQDLERSFKTFYAPNNLVLTIASSTDFNTIKNLVENHILAQKESQIIPNVLHQNEPQAVVKQLETLLLEVEKAKIGLGLKLSPIANYEESKKMEWCLKFLSEMVLSPLNPEYQDWLYANKISEYTEYHIDIGKGYAMYLLFNEGNDVDFLYGLVNKMISLSLDETLIAQLKKRYYSIAIRVFDSFESSSLLAGRNYFEQKPITYELDLIKDITVEDLQKAQHYLQQYTATVLYGKKG